MEHVIALTLVVLVLVLIKIVKDSIQYSKAQFSFSDKVIVSSELFEAVEKVDYLMNEASSIEEQKKQLPVALSTLHKEIVKHRTELVKEELAEYNN